MLSAVSSSTRIPVIVRDPGVLAGIPVFRGTQVPAASLFEHLGRGGTFEEFVRKHPPVTREMALAAVREAGSLFDAGPMDYVDLRERPALEKLWDNPDDAVFDDF